MASAALRAVVLVAVVLKQCCKVIVAARPLLMEAPAVATADGGWLEMIMQVLQGGPGGNNHNCQAPNGSCP
jgi:phosphosulfolactate phosphohydrolase-like enzyme